MNEAIPWRRLDFGWEKLGWEKLGTEKLGREMPVPEMLEQVFRAPPARMLEGEKQDVSLGDVPLAWYDGDVFLTLFCDALSLLFPEGERFFVDTVAAYKDEIDDPGLVRDALAFGRQESAHGLAHRAFNAMLRRHGIKRAKTIEKGLGVILDRARARLPRRVSLAVTCALEHFTALLGEQILTDAVHREKMHPSIRPIWVWHALEETEHKAVAFDVYVATGGGPLVRIGTMAVVSLLFFLGVEYVHVRLLTDKKDAWAWSDVARRLKYLWGKGGLFRRLAPGYLEYYRPDFHPNQRDASAIVATWRETLFGARGTHAAYVRSGSANAGGRAAEATA